MKLDSASAAVDGLRRRLRTVVVFLATGTSGVFGSYALAGYSPEFVVSPIANFLAKSMPSWVVTFGILVLGDFGQHLNLLASVWLGAGLLGLAPTVVIRMTENRRIQLAGIAGAGGANFLIAYALTNAFGSSIGVAVGTAVPTFVIIAIGWDDDHSFPNGTSTVRRQIVGGVLSAVGIGIGGGALARLGAFGTAKRANRGSLSGSPTENVAPAELLKLADNRSFEIGGVEPLVSREFYEVDINAANPEPSAEDWNLEFTGAIDSPFSVDYREITEMESEHRFVTLRCVGEKLNGRKMDNALWTGVPVAGLVDRAQPIGNCECVMLRAVDGYFEEFPIEALRSGFLAFGMNGQKLPRRHGYPVRALIPGHWGEVNVKWLTDIEFLDREVKGYWEKRGWHGTGPVNTVAKLHAVNRLDDGRIQIGGHAYAGIRGIDDVEVSINGGGRWQRADLSERLPGADVWRQWKFEYTPPETSHEVAVRAVDGTGTVQPKDTSGPFPSGPSGWVRRTVRP